MRGPTPKVTALQGYRAKFEDSTLTLGDIEEMLDAWAVNLRDLETKIQDLEDEACPDCENNKFKIDELEAELEARDTPEWGKRGCPESYLDATGFCSPACVIGAPRGAIS